MTLQKSDVGRLLENSSADVVEGESPTVSGLVDDVSKSRLQPLQEALAVDVDKLKKKLRKIENTINHKINWKRDWYQTLDARAPAPRRARSLRRRGSSAATRRGCLTFQPTS